MIRIEKGVQSGGGQKTGKERKRLQKGSKGRVCRPGVGTSRETHRPFLTEDGCYPDFPGQAWGEETKNIKRGAQEGSRPLLQGRPDLMPWGCAILCLPNKTMRCNQAVRLGPHFKSCGSETELWKSCPLPTRHQCP